MKAQECSQHFSHYKSMGIFPDADGQLTPKFLVRSCRISNPSETLWLSSLPTRIKKSQSKMKKLEWSQDFPHCYPMRAVCCHGNQSSDPDQNLMQPMPHPIMLQMIWFDLITIRLLVSEIFMFESVDTSTDGRTHGRTDARTPARVPSYKLTGTLRLRWANTNREMSQFHIAHQPSALWRSKPALLFQREWSRDLRFPTM